MASWKGVARGRAKWVAGENPGRDFMYTSRGTGNGYTSDITDCYCTLARFYKALKILFVIKFLRSRPPSPVARSSRMHAASFVHDKRKDDSEWFTYLQRARSLFTFGPIVEFFPGSSDFWLKLLKFRRDTMQTLFYIFVFRVSIHWFFVDFAFHWFL